MKRKIRILIADDHAVVRMGLSALLDLEPDMEVVAEAKNGEDAVQEARRTNPDIAILDLMMPKMDGVAATRKLLADNSSLRVVILTSFATADGIAHALKAGASGVIIKNTDNEKLVEAIRKAAAGESVIPAEIRRNISANPPVPALSPRQSDVLKSMTLGHTNKEIAKELGIGEDSVEQHVNVLLNKIGASNRTEAVATALRKHLLKI